MKYFFSGNSPYKNRARFLAILWTLLIFFLCFLPGNELPDIRIPLIDKWTHIVLFAVFTFLWLGANPTLNPKFLLVLMIATIFIGWEVEYIQGHYIPGRTQDNMDTIADIAGGAAGIAIFGALFYVFNRQRANQA